MCGDYSKIIVPHIMFAFRGSITAFARRIRRLPR